jgi:hypothetical protein
MSKVTVTDLFAAAFCLANGVQVASIMPGRFVRIDLDDAGGRATALLESWYSDNPLVEGPALAESYWQVMSIVRAHRVR